MARQFVISGSAIIKKVKISQAARQQLQNIAISVDTKKVEASIDRLGKKIQSAMAPLQKAGGAARGVNRVAKSFNNVNNAVSQTNRSLKRNRSLFIEVINKASAFRVSTIIINSFFNALQSAIQFTIQFDAALRDVNKILRVTDAELSGIGDQIIKIAKDFNLASEEVAQVARTAAQAGLAGPDASGLEKAASTISLTRKAAALAATTTLDFSQSLETLLAVMNQTNSTIEGSTVLVSKFSAVEDAAAVDAAGLAEVFKRAGTTIAQSFGPQMNDAIGLIAAISERSRQSSSVVGTFIKTLGARLSGANSEAINGLRELGVNITDTGGNLKNMKQILEEVADATEGLGDEDIGRIFGKIGGVRQAELFKVAIESLRTGRADELSGEAAKGPATQIEKATQEAAKFEASINRIKEGFREIVNSLKEGIIGDFLNAVTSGAETILQLFDKIGSQGSGAALFGGLGAVLGAGKLTNTLSGGALGQTLSSPILGAQGGATDKVSKSLQRRFKLLDRAATRLRPGLNKLRSGFDKANDKLGAFTLKAAAASVIIGAVGANLQEVGEKIGSKLTKNVGEAASTFAQFLPLGLKSAVFVTAVTSTINSFQSINRTVGVLNSNLQDTADFLRSPTVGQGPADIEGARQIEQQIESRRFRGGINDENRQQAELLANRVNAFFSDALDADSGIREGVENTKLSIREALEKGLIDGDEAAALLRKKVQEFVIDGFKGAEFGQIQDLLGNKEFTKLLTEDIRGSIEGFAGSGAGVADILSGATSTFALFSDAVRTSASNVDALTKLELKRNLELISIREQGKEAVLEALAAEQELFNVRADRGAIANIQTSIALQKELSENRIQALQAEADAIKARELDKFQRAAANAQAELEKLDARMLEISQQTGDQSKILDELGKKYDKLLKVREKNRDLLENETLNADAQSQINERLAAQRKERLAQFVQELAETQKLIEAQKAARREQIQTATDISLALVKEAEAREKVKNAIAAGQGRADPVTIAREAAAAQQRAGEIRLASLDEEIQLLRDVQATALESRKAELERLIDIERKSLTGNDELDAGALENIATLERNLGKVGKIQIQNGERINALVNRRRVLETELRTTQLNGAAKIIEAERRVADQRLKGAGALLDVAKKLKDAVKSVFEAQNSLSNAIRKKLDEAAANVKSKRGALSSAFDELASARESLIDSLRSTADAYADFNFALAEANNAADKVLGKFLGLRDQAGSLNSALQETISAAARAGASEEKLADLRKEAAEQQLALFEQLLGDTRSKAERFFTSSAEDRQNFVTGLASIQNIAQQFGGNIENFRNLDQGQLNDFGRSLISLPQEVRQNIVGALDQLPDDVGIAGLTQDEIREILQGASLGESEEVGIERLSSTIQTVADLTRQVAELNTSSLSTAQKSLAEQQAAVAEAKEGVLIAKNQLLQAKVDAQKTQGAIRDVTRTLNSQLGESRNEFKQKADQIIASLRGPENAQERQQKLLELLADSQQKVASVLNNTASLVGGVTPDSAVANQNVRLPGIANSGGQRALNETISRGIADANKELRNDIQGLTTTLKGNFVDNMAQNIEAVQNLSAELRTLATKSLQDIKAEVVIDNNQKINITGATEIVQALLTELEKKEFVTQQDLQQISTTLAKISQDLVNAGVSRPGSQIGN